MEKTIIDRCVRMVYRDYLADPVPENMPILEDLYNALLTQEEKDQKIQNATEYYKSTTKAKPGSLASKAQMVQQYNDKHAKKK